MTPRIAVLDYGIGNLGSVNNALRHVGANAELVTTPDAAAGAAGVVLPGVGAFGACMHALRASGLDRVALDAVDNGTPLFAVCVGLQLLYDASEESPEVGGLGVLPGTLSRLPAGVKHPQMQWNKVVAPAGRNTSSALMDALGPDPWVYFVHSFAAPMSDAVVGVCDYGGEVVAAVEHGAVWAAQFHPEKSSTAGLALLRAFAESL
ncbi:MAG TPA: imidazole glycerol phosphate synthase subunit HisH [Acidimicrobiales bacterium]|nr:imidazole glycerol phosphate synthase subunit HisH [Acidimicrobiales bacterium]